MKVIQKYERLFHVVNICLKVEVHCLSVMPSFNRKYENEVRMIDRIDSSIWYRVSMVMYTKSLWISMHLMFMI